MRVAPFQTTPVLLAIMMGFVNAKMIADLVFPRLKVTKQTYKYTKYDKGQMLIVPNTYIGRKGKPNKVEMTGTEVTGVCEAEGLDSDVPMDDIDNAGPGIDPISQAAEWTANLVALGREQRVASLVFDAAQYDSAHKTDLSGNNRWDVVHADSDPVEDISIALESCLFHPTDMTISRRGFSRLQRNPNIVKSVNKTSGDKGRATRQEIADLFELERINVGDAWANTAKKGQAASLSRLWGNDCLLHYTDPTILNPQMGMTFGFTAEYQKFAGENPDKDIGPRGGFVVRCGEYVDEHIMAPDCAYLIKNVCS